MGGDTHVPLSADTGLFRKEVCRCRIPFETVCMDVDSVCFLSQ